MRPDDDDEPLAWLAAPLALFGPEPEDMCAGEPPCILGSVGDHGAGGRASAAGSPGEPAGIRSCRVSGQAAAVCRPSFALGGLTCRLAAAVTAGRSEAAKGKVVDRERRGKRAAQHSRQAAVIPPTTCTCTCTCRWRWRLLVVRSVRRATVK